MKPLNELKKLLKSNPLAGLQTRQKYYSMRGVLTTANVNKPLILSFKIDDSEFFWWTGLRGAYYGTSGAFAIVTPFVQITNLFSQDQYFRTDRTNTGAFSNQGYVTFNGNISPGAIPTVPPAVPEPQNQPALAFDVVLEPQQILQASFLADSTIANDITVELLFIGFSQRLQR